MIVRPYREADLEALKAMYAAQGFDYVFPDVGDPIFVGKLMLENEAGRPAMASLVRLTSEVYLLVDPRVGNPAQRWAWLVALHEAARRDAYARGLDDTHAFLPPRVARAFGRRLERLGWVRDPWQCWSRQLEWPARMPLPSARSRAGEQTANASRGG